MNVELPYTKEFIELGKPNEDWGTTMIYPTEPDAEHRSDEEEI